MSEDAFALLMALRTDARLRGELREILLGQDLDVRETLTGLADAQRGTERRLEQLAGRVEQLAEAQRRTEARVEQLADAQRRTEASVRELALTVRDLVDLTKGMGDRIGKLDGDALERRYREKGQAYFAPIARRLRLLDGNALAPVVDDAEQAGRLDAHEALALLRADAVFTGLDRSTGERVHLVVEVSRTVAHHDVRRVRQRADLLAGIVGTRAVAVVAGEYAPAEIRKAAQEAGVWQVFDGVAVGPDEDLELD